jgi:hypothetical protein
LSQYDIGFNFSIEKIATKRVGSFFSSNMSSLTAIRHILDSAIESAHTAVRYDALNGVQEAICAYNEAVVIIKYLLKDPNYKDDREGLESIVGHIVSTLVAVTHLSVYSVICTWNVLILYLLGRVQSKTARLQVVI